MRFRKERKTYQPRWRPGDTVKLLRFVPPILSGSAVTIQRIDANGQRARYQVRSCEYPSVCKWVREEELGLLEGSPQ